MTIYTAITFAPVQGFIEKSRKLRDLYGASQILSYLSQQIVKLANSEDVISPARIKVQRGMPNRILLKGEFTQEQVEKTMLSAWKQVLEECRNWIEKKLPEYEYHWKKDWGKWGNYSWEIFVGKGDSITAAMEDLDNCKLSRGWTAVNWIGESSSLTGTDGIAFPGLGAEDRHPDKLNWRNEGMRIKEFYHKLAFIPYDPKPDKEPEGKYIAVNERLSIPELVKRLVTLPEIAKILEMSVLESSFSDIYRRPEKITEKDKGRWTGWFMGDGDEVGKYLKKLAKQENEEVSVKKFSQDMREWGKNFYRDFPQDLGRVIYAGGDDFLGVIYSEQHEDEIQPQRAFDWLKILPEEWKKNKHKDITLSVGFIWAGHSVPQRDILQHCREAEKHAKSLGRDRITIRILFNSGQYVQWTCPWDYLDILNQYRDREGKSNWSHVYQDLAQLKSRHAFRIDAQTFDYKFAINFLKIYFPHTHVDQLFDDSSAKYTVGFSDDASGYERATAIIAWINDMINIGWHLCSNTSSPSAL